MHSAVLSSNFLPKSQELRLVSLLEKTPRFSPWGVKDWTAPKGFKFQTIDQVPVPETVLSRDSDHAAVVIFDRYSNLVYAGDHHVVVSNVKDVVPTLHVIALGQLAGTSLGSYRKLENSTYFPFVNRSELRAAVPELPKHIVAHYLLKDQYFVWTWDSQTGMRSHHSLEWFNRSRPDMLSESIMKLTRDPISGLIVGEGNGIPPFVMSADGSKLMALLRTYDDTSGRVTNANLIERWRERLGLEATRAVLL